MTKNAPFCIRYLYLIQKGALYVLPYEIRAVYPLMTRLAPT